MKKILSLGLLFISLLVFAINGKLKSKSWFKNQTKKVYGHKVKRLSKSNGYSITNVAYQTFDQVKEDIVKSSENKMLSKEATEKEINTWKSFGAGGTIELYIERSTIGAANTEYFTIVVQDENKEEIFRKEFDSDIPERPRVGGGNWWNYTTCYLKEEVQGNKIYVYVIDDLSDKRHEFEILITK